MENTKQKIVDLLGRESLTVPCTHKLMHDENGCPFGADSHLMPFSLAVVLRAIKQTMKDIYKAPDAKLDLVYKWNLEHDNYDQQSEECKQFIGSLLGII